MIVILFDTTLCGLGYWYCSLVGLSASSIWLVQLCIQYSGLGVGVTAMWVQWVGIEWKHEGKMELGDKNYVRYMQGRKR
jgi:hypothetical protein